MKQSAKRVISLLVALGSLVAAIVIFFSFIVPLYSDIEKTRAEEAARRVLLADQQKIVNQVKTLVTSYQEGSRVKDIVSSALPLDPNVADALLQINGIAQINSVSIRSLVVSTSVAPPASRNEVKKESLVKDFSSFTIRIDGSSSYEDFKAFLRNLETNIRIFNVKNITFQPLATATQNSYSYSVTVTAYHQNQ